MNVDAVRKMLDECPKNVDGTFKAKQKVYGELKRAIEGLQGTIAVEAQVVCTSIVNFRFVDDHKIFSLPTSKGLFVGGRIDEALKRASFLQNEVQVVVAKPYKKEKSPVRATSPMALSAPASVSSQQGFIFPALDKRVVSGLPGKYGNDPKRSYPDRRR